MNASDNIKKTGLTPEDLLFIIRELKGSRITSLVFRGLKIEQSPDAPSSIGQWDQVPWPKFPDPAPPAAFSSPLTPPVGEAIEQDEDDLLDQIKLEDPEAYESLLEKRELENAESSED